jgi:two-component system, NtrC family, nitrogen regulation sensor histidine kinase NtrY
MRRFQSAATIGLVILGPILAFATFLVLGPLDRGASALSLRLVLLADLVYVLFVATLVLGTIARMIAARRARSAGSQLHLRLTGLFALIALIPTVTVAVFAGLTVNVGLEGWFSERVRQVVGASLAAAEAYREDELAALTQDSAALADFLETARRGDVFLGDGALRQMLSQIDGVVQRELREAYVIDSAGEIRARGERSYLFNYDAPPPAAVERARAGETVVIEDIPQNEFRALVALDAFPTGSSTSAARSTAASSASSTRRRRRRGSTSSSRANAGRLVFEFGLLYLGFAVILILGRDLARAHVRRTPVAARGPARRRGPARGRRAISTCRSSKRTATTRSPCSAASSTR